jgi:putative ABC transport system permease protein
MVWKTAITNLLQDLRAHKLRAALAVCGIAWGTLGIVLLLALGQGVKQRAMARQHGLGDGIVVMWPGRTTYAVGGHGGGRLVRLRAADILRLPAEIPELEAATPEYQSRATVAHGAVTRNLHVAGVHPAYRDLRHMYPQPGGRFINDEDLAGRRRVIFLGNLAARELFGACDPVGRRVQVDRVPFVVVGRLRTKHQAGNYGGDDAWKVLIPATTFSAVFNQARPDVFVYRSISPAVHGAATRKVRATLGRWQQFDPADPGALTGWDTTESNRFWSCFFLGTNLLMGGSGAVTLIVGGIGVASLMHIMVQERTREIGIMVAVGARPRDILAQFLLQALLITLTGGAVGMLLAWLIQAWIAGASFAERLGAPVVAPWIVVTAAGLLGAVGTVAGWFPARRAAAMDPVQALEQSL